MDNFLESVSITYCSYNTYHYPNLQNHWVISLQKTTIGGRANNGLFYKDLSEKFASST